MRCLNAASTSSVAGVALSGEAGVCVEAAPAAAAVVVAAAAASETSLVSWQEVCCSLGASALASTLATSSSSANNEAASSLHEIARRLANFMAGWCTRANIQVQASRRREARAREGGKAVREYVAERSG